EVAGPTDTIPARSRRSYNLGSYVTTYDVSIKVQSAGEGVVCERAMYGLSDPEVIAPFDDFPIYPFTRDESIACGAWASDPLDYPYFGAPRQGTRLHAGIDIYPPEGPGARVFAVKDGTVIRVEPFYTRYTGEVTWCVMVDHGDWVVNYGEVYPPSLAVGDRLEKGDLVGLVSGTAQLHMELYTPGSTDWLLWYGPQPANLLDPTALMLEAFGL
ncbi:MAG: M23 family metallopeptidase, partial [Actinobacteria bacterium]|nr:M23 family metallopeptidase [Actinomycetota bacterium]MBU2689193.1 M23 family metallopeptidase [Actinomycetota bacterium]